MEKNTTQSKRKIIITLLSTALFLVIMGGIVTVGWMKKNATLESEGAQITLSSNMEVSNIEELKAALEAEDTIKIILSKDYVIQESLTVRGKKTLCGDYSIAMALNAEADQKILHVKSGAELVLDGATIDGNHIATGIYVEPDADFTMLSGQVVYAQAAGLEVEGTAAIKGGKITETAHSGVVVGAGGKVEMTGGELVKNSQNAAYIVPTAYMKICDNAVVRDSDGMLLNVSGECDVIGVPLTGAGTYLADVTGGKLNVTQAEGVSEKLECGNAGMRAFQVAKDGELSAKNLYIHDVGLIGVNLSVGAVAFNMEDCIIQGVKEFGIIYRGSLREESHLTNVEIKDVEKYMGIQNALDTTVHMENITISNVGERGIANSGGIIKGKNIVVKDSKSWGVTSSKTDKANGEVEIDGLEIDGIGSRNAINSNGSTVKVNNVKISNVKGHGVRVHGNGKIVVNNAVIKNPEMYGMAAEEGSINFKNVKIYNAGARGAASVGGTITGTDLTVDTTKKEHGVTSSKKGKVNITGLTLKNVGTESKAANGFNVVTESVMNITDVTVSNVKGIGARCDHATLNMKNVQISDVGDRGVMNMAGAINAEKLVVTNAKTYGVTSSAVENVPGTLTIKDVTINKVGTNNGINCAGSVLDAKDITISDVKLHGLRIHKAGKAVVENITITDIEGAGVYTEGKNDIKITNIKIKDAGTRGVNSQDGVTTIKNMEIENTKQHGIACSVSAKLNITELSMKNAKGNGINAVENAQVTIDNGSMDNVGGYGARTARGAKVTLNNVDMNQCGAYGVVAEPDTAMVLKDVDINKPKARGVATVGGTITGKNVTITAPETEHGITGSANGVVNLSNVTITDVLKTGANGLNVVDGAQVTINGGIITNVANLGARAARGEATVTLNDVTIKNVGETAALAEAGGKVALKDVEVTGAKRGVQAAEPTLVSTLENVTLKEMKTYGIESKGGNVVANGVTVEEGVQYGVYAYEAGKIELNNATIDKPNYRGVVAVGGTITGDGVTVTAPKNEHAITGSGSGVITLANVTITDVTSDTRNGINATGSSQVTINGGTITNSNTYGARAASGATLTLNDVNIDKAGAAGVFVEATAKAALENVEIANTKIGVSVTEPTLVSTLANVTVKNIKHYGIESKAGNIVVNGLTVEEGVQYGVYAYETGKIELNNATINKPTHRGVVLGGGTITGNGVTVTAPQKDHAITASGNSVMTLGNVTIKDVVAEGKNGINATGSGVSVTINGGSITNVTLMGARVYNGATLALNGVDIVNAADTGVSVDATAKATLSDVEITGGKKGVYAAEPTKVTTLTNVTVKGVKTYGIESNGGNIVTNGLTVQNGAMYGVVAYKAGRIELNNATIENPNNRGVVAGYDGTSGTITGSGVTIKTVAKDHALTAGTSSVITLSNVTISDVTNAGCNGINATGSSQVTINGGSITNAKQFGARAASGATLTLNGVGITKAGTNALFVESTSTLNLTGNSVIDGENANVRGVVVSGTFNMEGGEIKNFKKTVAKGDGTENNGAAVLVNAGGTFNLSGGKISNNQAYLGGAVYVDGAFTMSGGELSDNYALQGGAVFTNKAITMNSGEIKNNTGKEQSGGIRLNTGANLTMNGGKITNNKVVTSGCWGAAIHAAGNNKIQLLNGEVSGNTSTNTGTYGTKNAIQASNCAGTTQIVLGENFDMGANSIRLSGVAAGRTTPVLKVNGNTLSKHSAEKPLHIAMSANLQPNIQIGCDSASAATAILPMIKSADEIAVFSVSGSNIVAAKK